MKIFLAGNCNHCDGKNVLIEGDNTMKRSCIRCGSPSNTENIQQPINQSNNHHITLKTIDDIKNEYKDMFISEQKEI